MMYIFCVYKIKRKPLCYVVVIHILYGFRNQKYSVNVHIYHRNDDNNIGNI